MEADSSAASSDRSRTNFGRSLISRILVVLSITIGLLPSMAGVASAAPVLTATPITWGVVGLDSNNVNTGPNTFASGARVCNTGSSAATNVTGTYVWTTANALINLTGQTVLSVASLSAGSCTDLYFNVVITRSAAAYDTTRGFRIDITATGLGTVSTPSPREVYVEKLVSQNRNAIDSVTGPTTVIVGNTYTYVLSAHTAPGGYEQLSSFLDLSNAVFQIVSVNTTYTAPAGGTNNTIYGDACGWQPDPTQPTYKSCVGPVNYTGGKVGGNVVTTYQVKIVGTGSNMSVYALVYDKSGGSYHYNSDFGTGGTGITSINAVERVDLSLTKSDSADPVTAGRDLTYTMVASNAGPSTAHSVAITDVVPTGTMFVSADNGGVESGGTVTWNLGDIVAGSSSTVHLTVHVRSSRTAGLSNTASATTTTTDTAPGNNSATEATAVSTSANLSITKSDSPDPVGIGRTLTYTLALANAGPSDALAVTVTDTLPGGVTYVSATPTQGSCSQVAGVITCSLGTVADGVTPSVAVVVTPTATGTITNSASVTSTTSDPANANNTDNAITTVQAWADLSVTKGDSPDPVVAGRQVTYTMVVTNAGPSTALTAVLTDPLPAGTTFVSADGGGTASGGTVTWSLGNMANGASATVHLVVAVNAGRTAGLSNTATVSSSVADFAPANDSATQGTSVDTSADLSISKADSPDPVVVGQNVTYTLSIGNAGPSDALGVSVTDALPNGVAYVSSNPSQGSCSQVAGTVSCSLGTVTAGGAPTVTIVATATGSGTVTNSASVSSTTSDPSNANNSDTEDTTISPRADLSIVKTDSPDPVSAGSNETYTLTVSNAGPSMASSVIVTDALPAGTTFVSATPSTGSCGVAGGVLTCSLGNIPNGGSRTVILVVAVSSSRTSGLSNTATVASSTIDPNAGNDSSTQTTAVQARADVGVAISDGADPVAAGTDLTYTVSVGDVGPSDATGVVVTQAVPAGTTFVSADGGGTQSGGTVTWNVGAMTAGSTRTFHVIVHVDPSRTLPLSTTVNVGSTSTDTNAANDSATEPTAVALVGDLRVTVTDGSPTAVAGGSRTYTITLANVGVSTVPPGAVVTNTIPAGTTATESEPACGISGGVLACTTTSALAPGGSIAWQLTLDIASGYVLPTLVDTAAVTTSPVADANAANDTDSDTDAIVRSTDLSITKTDGADPVTAGTNLTYSLTVANGGPSDATGVVVTDPLPAGTSFVSADGGGVGSGGTVTWNVGTVAAAGSTTVHVTVHVDAGRTTGLSNTGTVSGNEPDTDATNDSATETTLVTASTDLAITKSDGVDPVNAGGDLTYTLVVTNDGPSDASGVVVTDPLPAGTGFVSADGGGTESGGTVTWNTGALANGASTTLHVTVHVASGRTADLSNTASVAGNQPDPGGTNDSATETTSVSTSADLSITKSDSADPVTAGTDLSYTLVVTNDGPSDATGVVVSDPIPAGTSFVSADGGGSASGGVVTWNLGTLANASSTTLHVTVHVNAGRAADLSNTAAVWGDQPDPDGTSDSATETTSVSTSADLSITKSDSADPVIAGTDLAYTLVVTNDGPSDATGLVVSDPIPAGTSFVSSDGGGSASGGVVTWNVGPLTNGASTTLHVTVHVDAGRTTDLSNTASVSGNQPDPDATNDSATETTAVGTSADLSITKSDGVDPTIAGNDLTYTIVATNNGPSDATGVVVSDPLPVGTSFVSADGGGTAAAEIVSWNVGTLVNGASTTLHVSVHVNPGRTADLSNTANVVGDRSDPDASNDSATEATSVTASADVSITKSDSSDPVVANSDLTYTIVVTDNGPSDATGVVVTDPIPAGTSFVSADGGGIESGGTVTWNVGALGNGVSTTMHVTVHVDASRVAGISNTASVVGNQPDPDGTNDSATEPTGVGTSSDLSITKSDGADPVTGGTDLTYTIVATNNGPSDATGVIVTDPLPAGTSFVSADGGGTASPGTVSWNVGALANGASTTLHVTVHVNAGRTADLSNTASVVANEPDPDASNDSATEATSVTTSSDLSIAKSDNADPVTAGTDLTYTLVVTNDGPSDAPGVVVSDPIPAGTSFVSADGGGIESGGTVTWNLGTLGNGTSTTMHVTVHVDPSRVADLSNTASVAGNGADPNPSNDTSTEATAVSVSTDLSIAKSDSADPVVADSDVTYTIVVTDNGPSDATGVVVTDPIPAGTSFVSADGGGLASGGAVTWNVGALGNSTSSTVHVTLHVDPSRVGGLSNTASVAGNQPDPDATNDSATELTSVSTSADLSITKSDGADPVVAGTDLTYTLVATNNGPSDASGVIISDPIPAGTSFVSADGGGTESGGTATWNVGALANGASTTVHVTVHVNAGRLADLSNTASVAGNEPNADASNDDATEATSVTTSADLAIAKSDSADPVTAGTDLTYTLAVTNNGPSDAAAVMISDPTPAGTTFVSADNGGVASGGTVTWNLGALVNGASTTVHVTVHVDPSRVAGLSNIASVSGNEADPDGTNDSATETTAVAASSDLSITKSDGADPAVAGTNLIYTLVVSNAGPSDATGVVVTDPLPAGTSFVSADGGGAESTGTVTWTVGALADGASTTLHVTVHIASGRTAALSNSAKVAGNEADPDAANDSATEATAVVASSDLSITKSDGVDPVTAGTDMTYTITATNDGPSDAGGVVVSDPIPTGTSFVSADGGGSESAGTVTWNLGGLADGGSTTLHVTVHVNAGRTAGLSNTATVSGNQPDPDATNDSATEATAVGTSSDLSIVKTDGVDPVRAGTDLTYVLAVTNNGPSDATGVVVTDPIPAGTSFVSADGGGSESGGTATWNVGALANGASTTVHVTVHVNAGRLADLSNTASVAGNEPDADASNDTSTEATAVTTSSDLSITKSDSADPVTAGTDLTYTLVVTDNGPSDATGVVVTDPIPAGTSFVSADGAGVESGGTMTWNLGALANGASATVHVTVHVDPSRVASLSNTASVSGTDADPDGTNDSATEATAVGALADASVSIVDAPDPVAAGSDITYSLTAANSGPSDAESVVVTDTLPAGVAFVSATSSQGSCGEAAGVVTCSVGSLPPAAIVTITLVVTAPSIGTLTDTASVVSATTDTNAANDADSEDTTVTPAADLQITKSDGADPVAAGADLTYTLTVTNAGPSGTTGVTVTDPLSAGTSFVSADGGGVASNGTVTWNLGALANGASATVHVTVHVSGTSNLSNTANVTGDYGDPDPTNNSATETTTVTPSADLSITKTDDADPVAVGAPLTYTLTVTNSGPSDATGVVVSDPLPVPMAFVSATPSQGSCTQLLGTVSCSVGTVAAGGSATVDILVTPTSAGTLSNTATVTSDVNDPDQTNNSATEATQVTPVADLSITKSDSADPIVANSDLTYSIVVTDNGPSDATGVVVTDPIPAGTSFVSADGAGVESGGTVTWNLGALANGASATVHVTVHVDPSRVASLSNTASVTGTRPDPDGTNDSATETTAVATSADLSITKSDGVDPVTAGADLTYTIVATNNGPSDASGVVVSDPIPAGTSFVSADGGGIESGGTVTWNVGGLANGASAIVHVTVHVDPSRVAGLSNTASVSGNGADPDGTNDSSTEATVVATSSDLSITKSDSADPVTAGTDLTYTIAVKNNGPSDATGVTVSDPLPAGTSFVSADGGGTASAGTVSWTLGALADGASTTLHVTVHVASGRTADLSNTASVTGNELDAVASNDTSTEATAVTTSSDLSITKSDSADPVTAGTDLTYTLVVTDNGPSDATSVVVTDPTPAGTSFVSADGGGSESGGTVTWSVGALANGASTTLHVTVHVDPSRVASLSNTASVSGTDADPGGTNDSATEATTVATSAELSITKTDGADPIVAGTDLTYTLVATNDGPSDATGVVVTDPIPAGTSFVSADVAGSASAGTVTWNLGTLANGASATVHVTVHVGADRIADLSNTASVAGDEFDPDATNDSATETTSVATSADLAITKSDSADPVTAGTDLTYALVVTNNGPSDATGVVVSDPIPAGTSFVSADGGGVESGGIVTWSIGALANGASTIAHVTVHVSAARTAGLTNTATVTAGGPDPDPSDDSATESTSVATSSDLSITKTDGADPITAGSDLTYTLVVTNNGPSDAAGVVATDPLPAGTTFVSADNGGVESNGTVTWNVGSIADGAVTTLHVTVHVHADRTSDLSNSAGVSATTADPNTSNDSATAVTSVVTSAALSITKTDGADPVTAGTDLTYTIVVANGGPSDAAAVVVTDPLPAGTTFVSADNGGVESNGTVTWNVGSVAIGATPTVHVTVHVGPGATNLTNTASVAAATLDPDATDDTSTQATGVVPLAASADLSITKTDSADPATAGTDMTYTLTVTDNGPSDATGVVVIDPLPLGTAFVSADGGGIEAGGTVSWAIGALADGATATVHVTVRVDPSRTADLSNTASVAGDQADPVSSNDSATEATALVAAADLRITKAAAGTSSIGANLLYTITVTNDGPSDATGVVVTDPLPAGASFLSATSTQGTCADASGTVTCALGALANGGTATIALIVTPTAAGDLVNTASVSSDVSDPGGANDADTATTVVGTTPSSADLSLTKTTSPGPVYVGEELTYTITVTNLGPDAADTVTVTDPLDPHLAFVSADHGGTQTGGVVTWSVGHLSSGGSIVLSLIATVGPDHASLSNTATVTSSTPDPNTANDLDTATVDPIDRSAVDTDLSVRKTVDTTAPSAGDAVTYTIVVTNSGPGDATGVQISDRLPTGLIYGSSTADHGAYVAGSGLWRIGALAAGKHATLDVKARIADGAGGTSIRNVARVSALDQHDTDPRNDSARQDVNVVLGGAGGSGGGSGGTAFTGVNVTRGLAALLVLGLFGIVLMLAGRRRDRRDRA